MKMQMRLPGMSRNMQVTSARTWARAHGACAWAGGAHDEVWEGERVRRPWSSLTRSCESPTSDSARGQEQRGQEQVRDVAVDRFPFADRGKP